MNRVSVSILFRLAALAIIVSCLPSSMIAVHAKDVTDFLADYSQEEAFYDPDSGEPAITYLPGQTFRVSVDSLGNEGNYGRGSNNPSISSDGRYVAFESEASNLVTGDSGMYRDIFIHDCQTGETRRVSVSSTGVQANGSSYRPSISSDGRYVAFDSYATNLVSGDTNGDQDIFVHDCQTGETWRISVDSAGIQGNRDSENPSISSDGAYVAFESDATNLVSGDTNNDRDIFVHDCETGDTRRVSVDSSGVQANGSSWNPTISLDGRYVAFDSSASNLVSNDVSHRDIFVHDCLTGETRIVSVDSSGNQVNGSSYNPSISSDGTYVAFESDASNLVAGDTNNDTDIFVHDCMTGEVWRVSVDSAGNQADSSSYGSGNTVISSDGRYVAFESYADNLVIGDTNGDQDIFVHDQVTGETRRANVDSMGNQANSGWSYRPSISSDGRQVAFESNASNLVNGDTNNAYDVFVHVMSGDRPTITMFLINNGASSTQNRNVTLNNEATEYPTYYMASENSSFSGAAWLIYSTAPIFSLSPGYGVKTVYFKVKNEVGESDVVLDTIELRRPSPTVTLFRINDGAATTSSRQVALNNQATENPTHYMASESPSFTGAAWLTYSTAPNFTLSPGNGTKTVYFKVKNESGESNVLSDTINLQMSAPTVTLFQINNGAAVTRNRNVTLNNAATNNPTHYMASENAAFNGATWIAYSTAPTFALGTGYGIKTVYFKVKNEAGESPAVSDTITYKMRKPVVTLFWINNGAASTTSRTVTLNNTCTKNPTHYKASESPSLPGAWKVYSTAPSFTLSTGNGTKTVYFKVKNSGGQSAVVSDTIIKN